MKQVISFLIFIGILYITVRLTIRILPVLLLIGGLFFAYKWIRLKYIKPVEVSNGFTRPINNEREVEVKVVEESDLHERIKKAKEQ